MHHHTYSASLKAAYATGSTQGIRVGQIRNSSFSRIDIVVSSCWEEPIYLQLRARQIHREIVGI